MISIYKNRNLVSTEGEEVKSVEFRGLSTDIKPDKIGDKYVNNGAIFVEIDTGKVYLYDAENKQWREI